ncbi:hypothetical protein KUTeg_005421 [Tegillarca granosa]|uniref:Uncharacterized protein n=1 Tax=Tegillarca granosa TaxID=220873 RepID=A0ABQ9FNK5_TEGGR|nr:hypothetical protein KUTeg_005421 [Tegillarca granosa]
MTSLFVAVLSMPLVDDKKRINKQCEQTVMGDFSNPQIEVVEIPANCSEGIVNYHYPTASIDIVFRQQGVYAVCVNSKAMPGWEDFSVEDRTNQRNEVLGLPTKLRQVCTFTTNGNLNIRIEPKNLSYMLQVPFMLIDFKLPLQPRSTDSKNV